MRAACLRRPACCSFAFAGYARIATLGEEVRDPARTIPRGIPLALGITLVGADASRLLPVRLSWPLPVRLWRLPPARLW
ncbi:hypothetical protein GCM10011428_82210 [Streptomyces violaceus]